MKTPKRKGKKKTLARCFYRQDYKKIGSIFFILRIIELASKLKSFFLL